jgi:hypothetical protein
MIQRAIARQCAIRQQRGIGAETMQFDAQALGRYAARHIHAMDRNTTSPAHFRAPDCCMESLP